MYARRMRRTAPALSLRLCLAFVLGFVASCTKTDPTPAPEADAAEKSAVSDEALVLDLWAGVPPLTPTGQEVATELEPRPGPLKPKSVSETIEVPFPAPGPSAPATPPPSGKKTLEIDRFGPTGDASLVDAVRLSFSQPMVPLADVETLAAKKLPFEIDPMPVGEPKWLGTKTVAYMSKSRFPYSTTYKVTVPAGVEATNGAKLDKAKTWTFSTPVLELTSSSPSSGARNVGLTPDITLSFNQAIQRVPVLAQLKLRGGGAVVKLEEVPSPTPAADEAEKTRRARVVRLRPKTSLKPNTTYTLSLPAGVFGEGPNRSTAKTVSFSTYPPLNLSMAPCPSPCWTNNGIRVLATTSIADPRLKEKVRVEPEVEDLQVYSSYDGIRVSGSFEGLTSYSIEVDAGVTDSFGQSLAKPFKGKLKFGPLAPSLSPLIAGRSPAVLDRGPASLMTVRASGLSQLEIHARALGMDEVHQFLDAYWSDNYGWPLDRPPATYDKSFDISDSERKVAKLNVDLGKILSGKSSTIGWLSARSNEYENYGYKQRQAFTQMFEVTDLGITAALDNNDGTIMVTRFSDNALVSAANVEVFDREGTSLWSGKTGTDGLAQPTYPGKRPRFVIAKLGDDAAYMRLDQGDARSQWPSYGTPEASPRAFFFTERTPYKPGEKIHLSGIIRLETRGPEGKIQGWRAGATGSYTVTNPRGIEVAKGELKLSDFGSFSIDIETKEEHGTGSFNFNVTFKSLFGSNRSFYHSIPVETFRTPEFEVNVERPESKPLHFEQELIANVEAKYLHGAPMIDADVSYVVNRTDSGFTPPGDLNSGFSFGAGNSGMGRYSWYRWTPPARQVATGTGKTNAQGQLEVKHLLAEVDPPLTEAQKAAKKAAGTEEDDAPVAPATYSIQATVTDENRQAIGANGSFVVHPADVYVGLRSDRTVLREGEKTNVQAVVTDLAGERVASVATSVDIIRKVTERKAVEKNGAWTFKYETTEETISSCALQSRGVPVDCEVTAGKPGTYIVRGEAKDESGRATRTEMSIFVHGDEAVVWDDQKKRVDLVPDRKEYEPGDTIKLLVRSPFDEARGMVVVEREGIAKNIPLSVEGGAAAIEIPVTETMIPGFTVSSILVKGRTEVKGAPPGLDLGMPSMATGLANITVSKATKQITVELSPSATEIDPKGTLTLDVTTKDNNGKALPASMAIMVVDEGVLSLMNYQTPDPLSFFVRQRSGGVWLEALHANIMPRQDPATEVLNNEPTPDAPVVQAPGEGSAFGVGGLGLVGTGRGGGGAPMDLDEAEEAAPPPASAAPMEPRKKADKSGSRRANKPRPKGKAGGKDRQLARSSAGFDTAAAMAQTVSLRTLFATTAFFDPNVRTDASGKATIEIEMPENLTSFRVMAVALDPDTPDRFGSADTTVRVRKPIMIRPSLPRFANFGDRFEASVMVDNQTGSDQKVLVGTRGLNVELTGEDQKFVDIAAGESKEVRFDMAAAEVGTMRLQFAAMSSGGRDATEISLPVRFPATAQAFADYGMTSDSIERQIEPPKNALPGYGGLELTFSSTALSGLEDAVQYLVDYEYECAEQTASRMLPIFVLGDILNEFPIASIRDKTSRALLARGGIRKLWDKQGYDGGFGYWKSEESWPYVSTWATFALLEGKRAGYEVDETKLGRALDYTENFVRYGHKTRWGTYYDNTTRAFALWLLSREGRGQGLFPTVWSKRDQLPLYARAMLMSAAHRYKKTAERDEILAELREAVVESPRTIHFVEGKSEAGADGLRVLMHSNVQTDAIVLMAMLEVVPDEPMLPKVIAGILSERDPQRGGRWRTTHANAWALLAAARYFETVEAEEPDFAARVWLDATFAGQFDFKGRSMSKQKQEIPMKALLASGAQKLILGKEGPGKLYYRMGLTYAPEDLQLDAQEQGFVVYREYEALPQPGQEEADPEAVKRLEDGSWIVKAGTNVKVTINLVVRDRANYVVVDDGLPAGFEGQNPRFVTSVGTTPSSSRDLGLGTRRRWWYRWWTFDHTDMRDDRMLLFADHLPAGVYTYTYTARATNIGDFQLPPIKAEAMYEPERFGHSSSSTVRVVE